MGRFSSILGLSNQSLAGRILRLPLGLLPGNMTMPIWSGRLRGKKWIVGSSNHGCWLGVYERAEQKLVAKTVRPGTVFFDVGANVGFYTLLASLLVGDNGRVFAFEPLPKNIDYLEKHLALNGAKNVTLLKAAVSDHSGQARFYETSCRATGQISGAGSLPVELVSLDDLFLNGALPLPDYLKIDVEGAEFLVLSGAQHLLDLGRPTIFLSTHGAEVHAQCLSLLESLGYAFHPLYANRDIVSCDELVAAKTT
jgi:FkbM family methyltransferase